MPHDKPKPDKETNYPQTKMSGLFSDVALTVLGGAIAGGVGIWLSKWQRRFDAKNEFRVFIRITKGRIPIEGFYEFHRATITEIRDAISRMAPCLRNDEMQAIETAFASYRDIGPEALDDEHEIWRMAREACGEKVPQKPSDTIKEHLDRMYESVD